MKLRRIVIAGQRYLWRREHVHTDVFEVSPCVEKVIIYAEGNKKSPLRLLFKSDDNKHQQAVGATDTWCLSGAGAGVIWSFLASSPINSKIFINFNRPAVIAELILYFLANGWKPDSSIHAFEVPDALAYLNRVKFPTEIAVDGQEIS